MRAVLLLILFAGICVPQTGTVWGNPIEVNSYEGLVQALKIANESNTPVEIIITGSITLEGELPVITKEVTIKADPHQPLGSIKIDGAGKYRGLYINSSDPVEINGLNFTNCTANGSDGGDDASGGSGGLGGAIYVEKGEVILKDVHFQDNTARGGDGGKAVYNGPSSGSGGGNSEFGNGGSGAYDDADSRQGGIGAGDGGMQEAVYDPQRDQTSQAERTGGGGLGAGGAVFAKGGTIKFEYTQDYYEKYAGQNGTNPFQNNMSAGGSGGGGTAGDGDALGDGIFLLKGGIVFTTTAGETLRITSSIDGVAAASNLDWDDPETY
ncbi:MAG: hypothetical protein LBQ54_15525 [Planctomycetaceae bacterium]|nr:hypothetical protein [Planctomycetaceae bacterium]